MHVSEEEMRLCSCVPNDALYMMWRFAEIQKEMWLLVSDWLATHPCNRKTHMPNSPPPMSNPRATMQPSLGLRCSKSIL